MSASVALLLVLPLGGCKKTEAENLAEKRAEFQAQQRSKAIANYQQIVQKYPDSEYAAKAQERLRELTAANAPAKK
ncbi:MAG TPA: outer membrane protein assembly factor BamD [Chthoniobacteraceae bacterium]|nr:outer membrane protein assembly factor BamD [Chthoniobacteraceae bacterium]